jgi:hypothetical protein
VRHQSQTAEHESTNKRRIESVRLQRGRTTKKPRKKATDNCLEPLRLRIAANPRTGSIRPIRPIRLIRVQQFI